MADADQKPEIKSESELPEDLNAAMGKLMPFRDQDPDSELALPASLQDYIELIDWTGRCIAPGKRGSIPENLPPILTRLNIRPENYIKFIKRAEKNRFHFFIGPVERIREVAEKLGRGFFNPDSLWPGRSETVPSLVDTAFRDRAHRKRTRLYVEDARPACACVYAQIEPRGLRPHVLARRGLSNA